MSSSINVARILVMLCFSERYLHYLTVGRMFWTDNLHGLLGVVETCNLDGSERKVIHSSGENDLVGCALDTQYLYVVSNA